MSDHSWCPSLYTVSLFPNDQSIDQRQLICNMSETCTSCPVTSPHTDLSDPEDRCSWTQAGPGVWTTTSSASRPELHRVRGGGPRRGPDSVSDLTLDLCFLSSTAGEQSHSEEQQVQKTGPPLRRRRRRLAGFICIPVSVFVWLLQHDAFPAESALPWFSRASNHGNSNQATSFISDRQEGATLVSGSPPGDRHPISRPVPGSPSPAGEWMSV